MIWEGGEGGGGRERREGVKKCLEYGNIRKE